jgi:phosphatidylglycerol lysyltransferase
MKSAPSDRQAPAARLGAAWASAGRLFERVAAARVVRVLTPLLVLGAAIWIGRKAFEEIQPQALVKALGATPIAAIALAAASTAISYACLAGQEWIALKAIRRPRPLLPVMGASFAGNVLSSFMGFGLATGTALRLRLYRWARLGARKVAALSVLCSVATYLSGVVTLGLCLVISPGRPARAVGWPEPLVLALGAAALLPAGLWYVLFRRLSRARGEARLGPGARTAALAMGMADWIFSGLALFVLSVHRPGDLPVFLTVFLLGSLIGSLAGVPGGVGVLEATVLRYGGGVAHESAAALILYRAIYFLAPLALTAAGLAFGQLRRVRRRAGAGEPSVAVPLENR